MSWSSVSHSNRTMPTDRSSSSSSSNGFGNDDSIPTLIGQGNNNVNNNVNNNNNNSNDRMSMESVSSLSSSYSLLPYSTNDITMTTSRYTVNPTPQLPPRHRSVSVSGIKSAFVPPPPPQTALASASPTSMSTPFAKRTLQPIENRSRTEGLSGQVNADQDGDVGAPEGFDFLKSPTTLTFERMIEACTYIYRL